MSKIITIYCEGTKTSYDKAILEKVIDGLPYVNIQPIGSVRGAGAIINYKENYEVVKSDFYLLFRDRDYDFPIPNKVCLEQDPTRKYCYYSYKNTIENYLFDNKLLLEYCSKNNISEISSIDKVNNCLKETAEKIKFYQAVRHSLGKMRVNTDFGNKLTVKSGILPNDLSEEECKRAALKVILESKSLCNEWCELSFEKNYNIFINKFNSEFINELRFLDYFHGKDFATAFRANMPAKFNLKSYYRYAKENIDYTLHADLVQLRTLIISKLK